MITLILLLIIPLVLFVIIFLFLVFKIRNSQCQSDDIIYWRTYVKENQTPEAYKPYENIQIKKGGNDGE